MKIDKNKILHLTVVVFLISMTMLSAVSCNEDTTAGGFPECFVGTYVNTESSGARSIWNLHKDGNFSGESSTQQELNFSSELGSWKKTGNREAKIVLFDFSFDSDGFVKNIARADINITFLDENCEETKGSFQLRFFENGEDPFDINTYNGEVIEDTFTGRKLIL